MIDGYPYVMNTTTNSTTVDTLKGFVTEKDLALAEIEFPGISAFFAPRRGSFRTFLDLVVAFLAVN